MKRNNLHSSPAQRMFVAGRLILMAVLLTGAGGALLAQTVQVFSSSGTFTVPACVTSITVQCWGAGGGGGGASEASGGTAGSGGGGGGFAMATLNNVSGTYTVTVGTGGSGGVGTSSSAGTATAGGNSIFTNGTVTVTGVGGGAGTGSTGGVASTVGMGGGGTFAGGASGTTYKGGNGAIGNNQDDNTGGAGGGGAGNAGTGKTPNATGDDANGTGGQGGTGSPNTTQYAGGAGGSVSAAYYENGGNGSSIGGGGAGGGGEISGGTFGHGTYPGSGGSGGNGQVIVSYTTSTPTITSVTGGGCVGSLVTINGTLLSGATSVDIGAWALNIQSNTATVITGTIVQGTTTGTVKVTTSCGTATSSSAFVVNGTPTTVNLGNHTLCNGSSYAFGGHTYTTAGTYNDTATGVSGCDSITSITLVSASPVYNLMNQTICSGSTYTFAGHSYSTAGSYSDTASSTVTGCDSITILTLSVSPAAYSSVTQEICPGSSYNFNGVNYSLPGTYADTLASAAANGCDSIAALILSVKSVATHNISATVCNNTGYSFNGRTYTSSGIYADTLTGGAASGCDSIVTLVLSVNPVAAHVINASICNGASYSFNGQSYSAAGTYADTLSGASANGCDSIVMLNLSINSGSGDSVTASAAHPAFCTGDSTQICATPGFSSYLWNTGDTNSCFYSGIGGTYQVTVTDNAGCSGASNAVTVSTYSPTSVTISVNGDSLTCYGESGYQWYFNGAPLAGDTGSSVFAEHSGNYLVQITDSNGCRYSSTATAVNTGIGSIGGNGGISVFPNPLASGNWQIDVPEIMIGGWCEVFDAAGKSIFKSQITNQHSGISLNAAKGVYLMQVHSAEINYNFKLIKL